MKPSNTQGPTYADVLRRVRDVVEQHIPAGRVVAVISRGDDQLIRFPNHRGWHFPRGRHGLYAGHHPANDDEAQRQLDAVRDAGAGYLVVPHSAAWWFDFYKVFSAALAGRYRCVHRDDACVVYDLAPERPYQDPDAAPAQPVPAEPLEFNGEPLQPLLVTVIVPIFNAPGAVRPCIESLVACTPHPHQVLLVDDGSTHPDIWPMVQAYARSHPHIRAARHRANRGYTATINAACRLAPGDVVLLNSDTEVSPGWLEKLCACAACRDDVATATAVSNAAGAFSIPKNNAVNELPADFSVAAMAQLVEQVSDLARPVVPTGNGFCLYITRRALDAVGGFDETEFPQGYGAENDFCMRAQAMGFVNLVDDATFIHHRNAASFGDRKQELLARSAETLRRLHPTYKRAVTEWLANDPLDDFRRRLAQQLVAPRPAPQLPCLLTILHDGAGGTPLTNEDMVRQVAGHYRGLVLKTGVHDWWLEEFRSAVFQRVRRYTFPAAWRYHLGLTPDRLGVLRDIFNHFDVRIAHVRHLLGNGPELLDAVASRGIPIVFSFHDFYTACPTIQLIDEHGRFCGGTCTAGDGPCALAPSWFRGDLPALKHRHVHEHRARMDAALRRCTAFVTTSESAREQITSNFPFLQQADFRVIEHGRDLPRLRLGVPPQAGRPVRAVCLGNLDRNKGAALIEQLLIINAARGHRFEFHFLGGQSASFRPERLGGINHGRYERDQLQDKLRAIGPSFSLIASIWPETYCHALTESWAAGLPVFASSLGALRERIARHGGGWLLDPHDAESWYAAMVRVTDDPAAYANAANEIARMPIRSAAEMAGDYMALYDRCMARAGAPGI